MRMPRPGRGLGSVAPIACPLALRRGQWKRDECGVWMLHRCLHIPPALNTSSPQICSHDGDSWHVPFPIPWHVLMVTRLAWMAHRLVSSSRCTMKSSDASCKASRASAVHRKGSGLIPLEISRTCAMRWVDHVTDVARAINVFSFMAQELPHAPKPPTSRAKGSFGTSKSVVRWNLRISRSATVPGLYLCGRSAWEAGRTTPLLSTRPHYRCIHLELPAYKRQRTYFIALRDGLAGRSWGLAVALGRGLRGASSANRLSVPSDCSIHTTPNKINVPFPFVLCGPSTQRPSWGEL